MKFRHCMAAALFLSCALPSGFALGQQSDKATFSPETEAKAREVGKSLRCVVCQNQSIEDSGAPLAADMRQLVRERIAAGDSPDQVRAFMTERYGNFVLMKPPLQPDTYLLWIGPFVFLILGAICWRFYLRRRAEDLEPPAPLTDEERSRLSAVLSEQGTK